jgi:hypothetical protein
VAPVATPAPPQAPQAGGAAGNRRNPRKAGQRVLHSPLPFALWHLQLSFVLSFYLFFIFYYY